MLLGRAQRTRLGDRWAVAICRVAFPVLVLRKDREADIRAMILQNIHILLAGIAHPQLHFHFLADSPIRILRHTHCEGQAVLHCILSNHDASSAVSGSVRVR